jgi:hypothetical protein
MAQRKESKQNQLDSLIVEVQHLAGNDNDKKTITADRKSEFSMITR